MSQVKTYNIEKGDLIRVNKPEQTNWYKPVEHERLIDLTLNGILQSGFELDKEEYSASQDGLIANGKYTIKNIADNEMQIQIGWQNSYNKRISLKWAIGTQVFICQNGCVSGNYGHFKRKHVGDVQEFTPRYITEYIKTSEEVFTQMQKDRDVLKNIEIDRHTTAQLLGEMYFENDFIQSTQLNIIKRELDAPTHDYGCKNSMWELYNFCTFAMKSLHPTLWMDSHIDAHNFFTSQAGIITPIKTIVIPEPESPFVQLDLFEELWNKESLTGEYISNNY